MELGYPLVRVPFEEASKNFRLYHKQLTRELAQATAQIEALDDSQQPGHRLDVDAAINKLVELAQKLRELKQSAKNSVLEQQTNLESCISRVRYLEMLEGTKIDSDLSSPIRREHRADARATNDRLVADYLLSQGYLKSAKIVQDTKDVAHLVDHDLHVQCQAVLEDLHAHLTTSAIEWCSQNGSRLRRLQSPLEFHLRLQDFIELVRSRKPLDAVQYARAYLTPLALQPDKQELQDTAIGELQVVMATLAFESPEKCGIQAYEEVFAIDRWLSLEKMFRKAFTQVYGMHEPPSLCIALHAGLSTLNTRACHLARDAILKGRLARSGTRSKRQHREGEEGNIDEVDGSGDDSDEAWLKPGTSTELVNKSDDSPVTSQVATSKKRKFARIDFSVPICPTCSEVGSQMCAGLPFAYHPHSRLVCRVTQSVMDEHNPPRVLPNGRVYSKRGIDLLTQQSSDGTIKCVETHDVFTQADVKPVYIL